MNPKSIKENKEYAGLIYKDSNGLYHYTKPNAGGPRNAVFAVWGSPHDIPPTDFNS